MTLPTVGETFGNLRLDKLLGEGAMGVVYRAHHLALGIDVAVKMLKDVRGSGDPRFVERFQREAQVLARIDHPGIVRVLDIGERDRTHFLVMELVDGYSLDQYLRKRQTALSDSSVLRIIGAVASALDAAHRAGVIHRDLKPANILISRAGQLKVADLGMAKAEGSAALTRERTAVGSPAFMAPESLSPGQPIDHRVDLYALGVIGYQLVFGRAPYVGTISQVIHGHLGGRARFDLATTCRASTVAIVRKLMAHDVDDRYAQASMVLQDVRQALRPHGPNQSDASASHGSSELVGLVRMLEKGLEGTTSERGGEKIVHTTKRERLLVWLLLAGVVALAIIGYIVANAPSAKTTPSAQPAAAEPAGEPQAP